MPPVTDYNGAITIVDPLEFSVITDPTGKYFTTADAKIILWSSVIASIQAVIDGSETKVTGTGVTGSGTDADPYVIASGGGSGATSVVVANIAALPAVGTEGTVYFVFDKDGSGTNGIYTWNNGTAGFEDMTPGSSAGSGLTETIITSAADVDATIVHSGTAPTWVKNAAGDYTLTCSADTVLSKIDLDAVSGSAATDGSSTLTVKIVHPDGNKHRFGLSVWNENDFVSNWSQSGLSASAPHSGTTTTYTVLNIGGFNSFQLIFS